MLGLPPWGSIPFLPPLDPLSQGYQQASAPSPLQLLEQWASGLGLQIAPNPTGGKHVNGSLHYFGRAIDVSVAGKTEAEVQQIIQDARDKGFRVLDERYTGPGPYGVSTGPHLHVEIPFGTNLYQILANLGNSISPSTTGNIAQDLFDQQSTNPNCMKPYELGPYCFGLDGLICNYVPACIHIPVAGVDIPLGGICGAIANTLCALVVVLALLIIGVILIEGITGAPLIVPV